MVFVVLHRPPDGLAAERGRHEADDLREVASASQVTKQALTVTEKSAQKKKRGPKITINDIAEDCGINHDLLCISKRTSTICGGVVFCRGCKKRWMKKTYNLAAGSLQIFEAVQENRPFIMNVYRCVHAEQVEKYLQPLGQTGFCWM